METKMNLTTFITKNGNRIKRSYELLKNGEIVLKDIEIEENYDNENVNDDECCIYGYNENTQNSCNLEDLI